jgi:predicted glycosyltransferase
MRILIDIGHPAHVHLFKNLVNRLKENNHEVVITVREIPGAIELLEKLNLTYISLGKKRNNFYLKGFDQVYYFFKLLLIAKKRKISVTAGCTVTIALLTRFTGIPSILLDDDDDQVEPLFVKYGHKYASLVLTPSCIKRKTKKAIYYNGIHELAYLQPTYFKPDNSVINELGVDSGLPFFILRFVAFRGHHDRGMSGFSLDNKKQLVRLLERYGRVFITSEKKIEPELEKYRIKISAEKIHSALFYSTLFIGDSQTMTSEACILGTPAVKMNTFAHLLSVPEELEDKYHLCQAYKPGEFEEMMKKIEELLADKNLKALWQNKRDALLLDKIDVTAFFVWFIENYPQSFEIMKNDPDYQLRFK